MVYDVPAFAGIKLDVEMVLRLARHPNVVGFKDSSGDMATFRRLAEMLSDRREFYLLQGKEHLLLDSLSAGASGFVVSLVHLDPRPFVGLLQASRAGSDDKARSLQTRITALMNWIVSTFGKRPGTSTLFHALNVALRERGVCDNILLAHEGETPDWLRAETLQAVRNLGPE